MSGTNTEQSDRMEADLGQHFHGVTSPIEIARLRHAYALGRLAGINEAFDRVQRTMVDRPKDPPTTPEAPR